MCYMQMPVDEITSCIYLCRRQRSSSADLDPRSHTAGQSLNEKQVQKGGKSGDIPAEHSSKQQPARRDQSATNGAQAHKFAKESPTSGKKALGRNFSAAETGRDMKLDGKDVKANKRTRAEPPSKQVCLYGLKVASNFWTNLTNHLALRPVYLNVGKPLLESTQDQGRINSIPF